MPLNLITADGFSIDRRVTGKERRILGLRCLPKRIGIRWVRTNHELILRKTDNFVITGIVIGHAEQFQGQYCAIAG